MVSELAMKNKTDKKKQQEQTSEPKRWEADDARRSVRNDTAAGGDQITREMLRGVAQLPPGWSEGDHWSESKHVQWRALQETLKSKRNGDADTKEKSGE